VTQYLFNYERPCVAFQLAVIILRIIVGLWPAHHERTECDRPNDHLSNESVQCRIQDHQGSGQIARELKPQIG